jgi:hypothetical protein
VRDSNGFSIANFIIASFATHFDVLNPRTFFCCSFVSKTVIRLSQAGSQKNCFPVLTTWPSEAKKIQNLFLIWLTRFRLFHGSSTASDLRPPWNVSRVALIITRNFRRPRHPRNRPATLPLAMNRQTTMMAHPRKTLWVTLLCLKTNVCWRVWNKMSKTNERKGKTLNGKCQRKHWLTKICAATSRCSKLSTKLSSDSSLAILAHPTCGISKFRMLNYDLVVTEVPNSEFQFPNSEFL